MNHLNEHRQFSTFYIGSQLYGIDVMHVQEIALPMPLTKIHRSPFFVKGLINLRGQISTAISLREVLKIQEDDHVNKMTVVCKNEDGILISVLVDQIGDVMELEASDFESTPVSISQGFRQFISGVYKTPDTILTIIDVKKLFQELENKGELA